MTKVVAADCSFKIAERGVLVCDPCSHVEGVARKPAEEVV